jgi:hypothetical protein
MSAGVENCQDAHSEQYKYVEIEQRGLSPRGVAEDVVNPTIE